MLPSPNLDDRRFQDLVDDAKRMVAQNCPEWTDHNVSDPGVTLIETFAFMVDQLFYRLNRVPDRLYVAFLDLLGVTLHPPTAASAELLMWLSAPQPDTVVIPQGTEVVDAAHRRGRSGGLHHDEGTGRAAETAGPRHDTGARGRRRAAHRGFAR